MALTQHLDRSVDKNLLKGTIGRVHSWQWQENDRLPSVVYVKFEKVAWKLDGIDEPGVYPIRPVTEDWYLDGRRSPSVLKIKRRQVPLSPAYAMTAHSSQGKTLAAVLLDLNVDKKVDTTFGTVAASRVRCREDCLILRPFPQWLFKRGMNEGPSLLLQTLRGESIDWAAFREGRKPFASCRKCEQVRSLEGFEHEQWENVRKNLPAMCMRCKHGEGGWTIKPEAGQRHTKICVRPMQSQQDRGLLSTGSVKARRRGCKEDVPLLLQGRYQPTLHQLPSHKGECRFPPGHGHNAGGWIAAQSMSRRSATTTSGPSQGMVLLPNL